MFSWSCQWFQCLIEFTTWYALHDLPNWIIHNILHILILAGKRPQLKMWQRSKALNRHKKVSLVVKILFISIKAWPFCVLNYWFLYSVCIIFIWSKYEHAADIFAFCVSLCQGGLLKLTKNKTIKNILVTWNYLN